MIQLLDVWRPLLEVNDFELARGCGVKLRRVAENVMLIYLKDTI